MKLDDVFDRLLVRPPKQSGESDHGYWLRMANNNGLQNPKWLLERAERGPLSLARCCVDCLRQPNAIWLQAWEEAHTYWCAEHLTWLIDRCQSCGRRVRWSTVRYLECSCGHDLRVNQSVAVDPGIVELVSASRATSQELRVLGTFAMHGPSGKPGKKTHTKRMDDVKEQILAGAEVVSNWPQCFIDSLNRHRVEGQSEGVAQLLKEAFPGLDRFTRLFSGIWRQRVEAAIDEYCRKSLDQPTPILGRNALVRSRPQTLKSVATGLGVRVESVARLIDSGTAPIRGTRVTAAGRKRRVVSTQDVPVLRAMLGDAIEVKRAARLMALPVSRIRALISSGLLEQVASRLSLKQIQLLQAAEQLTRISTKDELDKPIALREALRRSVHRTETPELIRAIHQGALDVLRATLTSPLGGWHISAVNLSAWLKQHRDKDEGHLTLGEVSSKLGLKGDAVRDLIRVGILRAQHGIIRKRWCWCVRRQDLESFVSSYVPLSFLTTAANVRARDGYLWAVSQGLDVVTGPNVDGSRQYFARRPAGVMDWT